MSAALENKKARESLSRIGENVDAGLELEEEFSFFRNLLPSLSNCYFIYTSMESFNKYKTLILLFLCAWLVLVITIYTGSESFYKNLPKENPDTEFVEGDPEYTGEFYLGKVVEVIEEGVDEEINQGYQLLRIELLSGDRAGEEIEIPNEALLDVKDGRMVEVGEKVIVNRNASQLESNYVITEKYRLDALILIGLLFVLFVIATSGYKGLGSVFGLIFTVVVLVKFVVPQILEGKNPLIICIAGALIITTVSIYLAHGFSRKTSLAVLSTLITVTVSAVLAFLFVDATKLFGLGSEESYFLKFAQGESIDLRGLLLGGIVFGALGVLDDVTTAQTASIYEIKIANPMLEFGELYRRGLSIGREHIASLINTLALAYIGSSFPVLLLFTLNKFEPIWTSLNDEFIAEEIVRTLIGSSALVFAVPISTYIAAKFLKVKNEIPRSH
ncbi:YibE/F family protein [Candidatus Dojkabacteria bacterium]|nr:YibE/F family protein [Candidatus Dojkabacteria bacterium]